jgi:dienelactone hydrolase
VPTDELPGFDRTTFTASGKERAVYRTGSGPAVVVLAESPGITPLVAAFARRVAGIGCTAVVPHLFGVVGKPPSPAYGLGTLAWACVSRDFTMLATGRPSPVTDWLRSLAAAEHDRCGGPGVGVVGMCLTGGFALAMAVDPAVLAPVLSQPGLPLPVTAGRRRDLGMTAAGLAAVRRRVRDEGLCVLGLRFTGDRLSPGERFARLRDELGDGFDACEIDSSPGNPWDIPANAHSVLTEHLVDADGHPTREALDRVLGLLRRRLVGDGGGPV